LSDDMKRGLTESIEHAVTAGVAEKNIILDPGLGFAKTPADNLVVMKHLEEFADMGYTVLLGTSPKPFLGDVLDKLPDDRDYGTGATTCLGIVKGAQIVRVHNVQLNVDMAKMMDAMLRGGVTVG